MTKAAVIASGAVGNAWLSGAVGSLLPEMLREQPGKIVTGLGTAGLLGAGVGMVSPRFAGPVFFGGVLQVVLGAVKDYVLPALGMGDYLTRADAATARPLGDYLTRADAATARPLGDAYVGEELAAYAG